MRKIKYFDKQKKENKWIEIFLKDAIIIITKKTKRNKQNDIETSTKVINNIERDMLKEIKYGEKRKQVKKQKDDIKA